MLAPLPVLTTPLPVLTTPLPRLRMVVKLIGTLKTWQTVTKLATAAIRSDKDLKKAFMVLPPVV
jgi:hypothetical protein